MTAGHCSDRPAAGCAHFQYLLSCDQFRQLMDDADWRCQMCGFGSDGRSREGLVIDHDHRLGPWAVRGILCSRCNTHLGQFEHQIAVSMDAEVARRYLLDPWILRHIGREQLTPLAEPPLGSVVAVPAGPRWRKWGRFSEGWQLLGGRHIAQLRIRSWALMNKRYGPHRIQLLGERLADPQRAKRFAGRLIVADERANFNAGGPCVYPVPLLPDHLLSVPS